MDIQRIIDKIQNDLSSDPEGAVDADTELLMSGILESLSVVTLMAWLEDEMSLTIDPGLVTYENFENATAIQALCIQVLDAAPAT